MSRSAAFLFLLTLAGLAPSLAAARAADTTAVESPSRQSPDDSIHFARTPIGASPGSRHFTLTEALISTAVIAASFGLDHKVGTNFPDRGLGYGVEQTGEFIGDPTFLVVGTGALAVGGLEFHNAPMLRTAKELALAGGSTAALVTLIKVTSRRERPDHSNRYSFPSGHAAAGFTVASVVDREYGGWAGWLAYGAASSAAYARVADSHHYFSDVVAGAIIGRFMGRLFTRAHDRQPPSPER